MIRRETKVLRVAGKAFCIVIAITVTCTITSTDARGQCALPGRQPLIITRPAQLSVIIEKRGEPEDSLDVTVGTEPTHEQRILKLLEKPLTFDLHAMPLAQFAKWFTAETQVPIVLDGKALEGAGIGADTPIFFQQKNYRSVSGLNQILKDMALGWTIDEDVLRISTRDELDYRLVTRVYNVLDIVTFAEVNAKTTFRPRPLQDLFRHGECATASQPLVDIVTSTCGVIYPGWKPEGGWGSARMLPTGLLAVSQTMENHWEIERLLNTLRRVQTDYANYPPLAQIPRAVTFREDAAVTKFRQRLAQPATLRFVGEPLKEVVAKLSKEFDVPLVLDLRALEGAGVSADTPVNGEFDKISLHVALNQVLKDIALTMSFREDTVMVTTHEDAERYLVTAIYPARDLITCEANDEVVRAELAMLRETLQRMTADPKPGWVNNRGVGTIRELVSHKALIISQTKEVHEQIERLLSDLRKKTFEVRRSIHIESKPSFPSATYTMMRDASGKIKFSADELAKALKKLLPDIDWAQEGTALITLPDRLIVRHERRTLERIAELRKIELNGWIDEQVLRDLEASRPTFGVGTVPGDKGLFDKKGK